MRHTQPTTVIIKQMDIYFTLNNESHLQLHCLHSTAHKHKADKFFGQICAVCVCSTQTSYCGIVVNRKKEENDMGLLSMPAKQQNSKTSKNSDSAEHIRRRIWISYYINNIGQWANGCECENANVLSSFFGHINSFPWPQDPNEQTTKTNEKKCHWTRIVWAMSHTIPGSRRCWLTFFLLFIPSSTETPLNLNDFNCY